MDADPFSPPVLRRWLYWPDGYQIVVETAEALARMPPDYGTQKLGPFRGTDLATLQWEIEYGPFAPRSRWLQVGDSPRNAKLYAPGWFIIEKHAYAPWELLPPPVTPLQEELRLLRILRRIPDNADLARSARTGGWFFGAGSRDAYDRRYDDHDLTGIEWAVYPRQDTAPTPKPEDVRQRDPAPRYRRGRRRRYANAQTLHDQLVTVGKTLPQDSLYRQEDYAEALGMGVNTLRTHLRTWRKQDPAGLLGWERIVADTKAQHLG